MKNIEVKNWKGHEYKGEWNEKFYESQLDEHKELIRIYINNERIHITEEEKENLLKTNCNSKIEEDNIRIGIIKDEFNKLDKEAQQKLIEYLQFIQ